MKVLIIEDSTAISKIYAKVIELFSKDNHIPVEEVKYIKSIKEFDEMEKDCKFDLVISDNHLSDGEILKSKSLTLRSIASYLAIVSGYTIEEEVQKTMCPDKVIMKPITVKDVTKIFAESLMCSPEMYVMTLVEQRR